MSTKKISIFLLLCYLTCYLYLFMTIHSLWSLYFSHTQKDYCLNRKIEKWLSIGKVFCFYYCHSSDLREPSRDRRTFLPSRENEKEVTKSQTNICGQFSALKLQTEKGIYVGAIYGLPNMTCQNKGRCQKKNQFFLGLCPKHRTPPTHRARLGKK